MKKPVHLTHLKINVNLWDNTTFSLRLVGVNL